MRRRSALARRSFREWAARGTIALIAAVAGYVCITSSLAQAVAGRDVGFAHRLALGNGRITSELAMSLSGAQATIGDRRRADTLAREALLQDATALPAVTALGVNAEVLGNPARARRLFAYSQKLSRRDLQTQLWAIEHAVAHNDVEGALKHYDIALRTSAVGLDILFPVLASATADPEIRAELVKTLAKKPNWGENFISYVAARGPDPRSTSDLLMRLARADVAVPDSAHGPIINALIGEGFFDEAWRYYSFRRPEAKRNVSRDPRFNEKIRNPSVFDWYPVNDSNIATSIQRGNEGGVFDFIAPTGVGGAILQQLQLLDPGIYRITGHTRGIKQELRARPYWSLSCYPSGREIGRVELHNSIENNGRFDGKFAVPEGCSEQMLVLNARPSDAITGVSGQIDRVQLVPER